MKKSRPGVMLTVLCRLEDREPLVQAMFRHTTTLGVREHLCQRYTLARSQQERQTPWGPVRVKTASGWGVTRQKPEYDDLSRIAKEHFPPPPGRSGAAGEVTSPAGVSRGARAKNSPSQRFALTAPSQRGPASLSEGGVTPLA